jgi:hypothetical protein
MFRTAGKAIAELSVELANANSTIETLRSQIQDLKKGQRKSVTKDPNQTPANVGSILRSAQKVVATGEAARKTKTKSDNELRSASEQAGSLTMEDMMFEFQI